MNAIHNLTMHAATTEQQEQGVVDLAGERLAALKQYLNIETLPSKEELLGRCQKIRSLIPVDTTHVMIGGQPALQTYLVQVLKDAGITPGFAFTQRESVEKITPEGVIKTNVFRHVGFTWID